MVHHFNKIECQSVFLMLHEATQINEAFLANSYKDPENTETFSMTMLYALGEMHQVKGNSTLLLIKHIHRDITLRIL